MFEKVNPGHPDKIADRIAGALVDLAYKKEENPKIAAEVLIGHGVCNIIAETSVNFNIDEIGDIVRRISGDPDIRVNTKLVPQDPFLRDNQERGIRCGDNGIFRGVPITTEQAQLTRAAASLWEMFPYDGKFILANDQIIICQSNALTYELRKYYPTAIINPLGYWTGGLDVDTGATNRKLGSDMGDAVTGGGLHGKDLSKADVSVNIYAHLKAQALKKPCELYCAIGDTAVDGIPYSEIVNMAKAYIDMLGGFEKFAEWGLIR